MTKLTKLLPIALLLAGCGKPDFNAPPPSNVLKLKKDAEFRNMTWKVDWYPSHYDGRGIWCVVAKKDYMIYVSCRSNLNQAAKEVDKQITESRQMVYGNETPEVQK